MALSQIAARSLAWSREERIFVLLVLCFASSVNLVDRMLISILIEPIKREFSASDTQMGLLTGLSFAAVYATAAFPIARYTDRGVRRNVIVWCVLVWGSMTMLCGFARSYWQLAVARMGVALGEAGYQPAAHSMIADLFPLRRRGSALGLFNAAASLGIGFGLFFGGWMHANFGWRTIFVAVGAPCLLLAPFIRLKVREPPRGLTDPRPSAAASAERPPLGAALSRLATMRTFRFLVIAGTSCQFVNYGLQLWMASFFLRVHGMDPKEVGFKLGLASSIGLCIGTTASGALADALGRRDVRWYMRVAGAGTLLGMPVAICSLLARSANAAFACYCVTICLLSCFATPIHAMTQTIVTPRMRGTAASITGFWMNLVGLGLGPLFVGMLNDHFQASLGSLAVRRSLLILTSGCVLAAYFCFSTNASIREDLAAADP
jgi:predicted MFS family arabinose efflux permease